MGLLPHSLRPQSESEGWTSLDAQVKPSGKTEHIIDQLFKLNLLKKNSKSSSSVALATVQVLHRHMRLVILSWTALIWNLSIIMESSIELHCDMLGVIKTRTEKAQNLQF